MLMRMHDVFKVMNATDLTDLSHPRRDGIIRECPVSKLVMAHFGKDTRSRCAVTNPSLSRSLISEDGTDSI